METVLQGVHDNNLQFTLEFGIGLHHAGLHEKDRKIVEELFVNQKIQVDALTTNQLFDQTVSQSVSQSITLLLQPDRSPMYITFHAIVAKYLTGCSIFSTV